MSSFFTFRPIISLRNLSQESRFILRKKSVGRKMFPAGKNEITSVFNSTVIQQSRDVAQLV